MPIPTFTFTDSLSVWCSTRVVLISVYISLLHQQPYAPFSYDVLARPECCLDFITKLLDTMLGIYVPQSMSPQLTVPYSATTPDTL